MNTFGMTSSRTGLLVAAAATLALVLAMMVQPAMAQPGNGNGPGPDKGNSLRAQATPVEIAADDVTAQMCANGEDVAFYAIDHNLGDEHGVADNIVWRETVRLGGENEQYGQQQGEWNTLYLGVSGPECGDIQHTGQVSVYYEFDGEWYSIVAQFNEDGELQWVNGVAFEEE